MLLLFILYSYDSISGLNSLLVQPISRSSAKQRAGRAGRICDGKCFRLCTESDFKKLPKRTVPEMQRSELSWSILQLKALGIDDVYIIILYFFIFLFFLDRYYILIFYLLHPMKV